MYLSSYVHEQLSALHRCDTITVDPHKSGLCPYPGGAICYRDRRINSFLSITTKVFYYHGKMILGDVGIEGSKPGAAAVGVMMANRVIIHDCFSVQTSRLIYLNTSRCLVEYSKQISLFFPWVWALFNVVDLIAVITKEKRSYPGNESLQKTAGESCPRIFFSKITLL